MGDVESGGVMPVGERWMGEDMRENFTMRGDGKVTRFYEHDKWTV